MGVIFYYSSRSTTGVSFLESGGAWAMALRNLAHAAEFGALALLLRLGLGPWRAGWRVYFFALTIAIAYAIGDEVHQGYTPGRVSTPNDVLVDAAGAIIALAGWKFLESWRVAHQVVQSRARPPSG